MFFVDEADGGGQVDRVDRQRIGVPAVLEPLAGPLGEVGDLGEVGTAEAQDRLAQDV